MVKRKLLWPVLFFLVLVGSVVWSQPGRRRHVATEAKPLVLVPATEEPIDARESKIEQADGGRHVTSNGIPNHKVGRFPNAGNPNSIRPQRYNFKLPDQPELADNITSIYFASRFGPPNMPFGVAVNGILFDPGTAEFWLGDRSSGWNYEALGGAVRLGLDENFAHVQPSGSYHYHGIPQPLLKELGFDPDKHSPLIGWAADGFPLYCMVGYSKPNNPQSEIVQLRPSFQLDSGNRPGNEEGPGGKYDGTFVQDYIYVAGSGDLDECNGRFCKTPEFPEGTYAYFLTKEWPVIPRAFRGIPAKLR